MSTGAYQPPTNDPSSPSQSQATVIPRPDAQQQPMAYGDAQKKIEYSCGECAARVKLARHDPVRCDHCGHRILYKLRTNR